MTATLLLLTGLAFVRRSQQRDLRDEFLATTVDVKKKMDEMEALEREQREAASKSDYLLSHLAGGRVMLDSIARLSKALPPEIRLRDMKLADPDATGRGRRNRDEATRVAFTVRRRGLVIGEVEKENDQEIILKGQGEPFKDEDIVDGLKQGVIKWPARVSNQLHYLFR
jgi:hypothetical protein